MRKFIIGFSVLLYAVSGIITYRALVIPSGSTQLSHNPEIHDSERHSTEPVAVATPAVPAEQTTTEKEVLVLAVLGHDTFSSGQALIDEGMIDSVTRLVPEIQAHPDHRVIVEGHISSMPEAPIGARQFGDSMDLSYLRAKAVARVLVEQGIPADSILVIGYGDSRPVAPNNTEEGRAKNHRIEIKLVPRDKES